MAAAALSLAVARPGTERRPKHALRTPAREHTARGAPRPYSENEQSDGESCSSRRSAPARKHTARGASAQPYSEGESTVGFVRG